jgi:hypothetical protein
MFDAMRQTASRAVFLCCMVTSLGFDQRLIHVGKICTPSPAPYPR